MRSRPARIFRQKPVLPGCPGKRAEAPTTARGAVLFGLEALDTGFRIPSLLLLLKIGPSVSFQRSRPEIKCTGRHVDAVTSRLLRSCYSCGAFEQIPCDLDNGAVLEVLHKRSRHPAIESAHSRPAPDLIIQAPLRIAGTGPAAGAAQVRAKT